MTLVEWLSAWGWGGLVAFGLFALGYGFSERYQNGGIADVCWGWSLPLLAGVYWVLFWGQADLFRQLVVFVLVGACYGRLAWHITRRFRQHWPTEDPRYSRLRQQLGHNQSAKMSLIFLLQASLMAVVSLPVLLAMANPSPIMEAVEWLAVGLGLLAFALEALADQQLTAFKAHSTNRQAVCKVGLWRYSRHPNYFGQWLFWVALALLATPAPFGWAGWVAPVLMLYFLLEGTGVKPAEAQALATKGEAYRQYQQETSAFIPWFPKGKSLASAKPS